MDRTSSKSRRWTALLARASGMVSATAVDGYRRAGGAVYEDLSAAEAVRAELAAAGTDLWSLRDGPSSQLLATWCAFALQSLGEQLVQFEYVASPRTVGYLSAMTAEQATVFFEAAGKWSARARRAAVDPAYDLADDVRLPAPLPTWRRMGPCPPTHVQAMLAAAGALRDRAQVALGDFLAVPLPADSAAGTPERLEGLYAQADAAVGQAEQMWRPSDYQPLHRAVEDTARDALEQLFRLGQILARPSLLAVGGTGNGALSASMWSGSPGWERV